MSFIFPQSTVVCSFYFPSSFGLSFPLYEIPSAILFITSMKVACLLTKIQILIMIANYKRAVGPCPFKKWKIQNNKWKNKCFHLIFSNHFITADRNKRHNNRKDGKRRKGRSSFMSVCFQRVSEESVESLHFCHPCLVWVRLSPPRKTFWSPHLWHLELWPYLGIGSSQM